MTTNDLGIESHFKKLKSYFQSGETRSYESRLKALTQLEKLVEENIEAICKALYEDLRKPRQESMIAEVAVCIEEIRLAKKKLKKWMKPKCASSPLALWPSRNRIHFEPLGTVLIIGPWNYPFQLLVAPLIGALAAGNCAVLKPSEITVHTSRLMAELFAKYFSETLVKVIEGGVPETTALLNLKFDHIFFTGSTAVGRIVMQAAAKNLVPVTLELGGKSPTIVCEDADLNLAARRIVWGKYYNAGQTCVAPDYIYVDKKISAEFLKLVKQQIQEQFGTAPKDSPSFARIVNDRNWSRVQALIDNDKVVAGGESDKSSLYIAPTVLSEVTWDDAVMKEEIFGPLMPIMSFSDLNEVYKVINSQPKPLSAYFFSRSKSRQMDFVSKVTFGGASINDVLTHLGNPDLPFGGVGDSGIGNYHGKFSFLTFSHSKSVMTRYSLLDLNARYAPYDDKKLSLLRRVFRV